MPSTSVLLLVAVIDFRHPVEAGDVCYGLMQFGCRLHTAIPLLIITAILNLSTGSTRLVTQWHKRVAGGSQPRAPTASAAASDGGLGPYPAMAGL